MARRAPAVMVFSSSTDGVSHNPSEDTPEDDLRVSTQDGRAAEAERFNRKEILKPLERWFFGRR